LKTDTVKLTVWLWGYTVAGILQHKGDVLYGVWNFNSGNYLFTTDRKL